MNKPAPNRLPGYDARTATIHNALSDRAARLGDKTFVTWLPTGSKLSYSQLNEQTLRVGAGLAAAGVRQGSHVGILMDNCPEQLLAILGPARSAFVSVPLNSAARGQLLGYFLDRADCESLIVEEALLPRFVDAVASAPRVRHLFVVRPDRGEPREPAPAVKVP